MGTVTLTNREAIALYNALRILARDFKMSPRFGFWVTKTVREVEGVLQVYDENRMSLIEKHAIRNEGGEYVKEGDSENIKVEEEFWSELNELLNAQGPDVKTVKLSEVETGISASSIDLSVIEALLPVIEE